MTCIVAVADGRQVWMGADSEWSSTDASCGALSWPKIAIMGDYLIGMSGLLRTMNLVYHSFLPPPPPRARRDLMTFMVNEFVPQLKAVVEPTAPAAEGRRRGEMDNDMLVGIGGSIYYVDSDFAVIREPLDYSACGSGRHVALGSLGSSVKLKPRKRLELALKLAERHAQGVKGRFRYLSVGGVR